MITTGFLRFETFYLSCLGNSKHISFFELFISFRLCLKQCTDSSGLVLTHGWNAMVTQDNSMILVSAIEDIRKEFNTEKFNRLLSMPDFLAIFDLYKEYCKEDCKEDNGPLKLFWNSYLEMVEVPVNFLRATREGNWDLYLECIKDMLPWFFAYDHTNYARYLPLYLAQTMVLPETHPEAHALLLNGDFGVQRATSHGFSQMPVDQTIEQTLSRSTKTKGGIVGFSLRKGAVLRWMILLTPVLRSQTSAGK